MSLTNMVEHVEGEESKLGPYGSRTRTVARNGQVLKVEDDTLEPIADFLLSFLTFYAPDGSVKIDSSWSEQTTWIENDEELVMTHKYQLLSIEVIGGRRAGKVRFNSEVDMPYDGLETAEGLIWINRQSGAMLRLEAEVVAYEFRTREAVRRNHRHRTG